MNKWFTMAVGLAVFVLTGVTVQAQKPMDSIVIRKGTLFLGTIVPVCSQCGHDHEIEHPPNTVYHRQVCPLLGDVQAIRRIIGTNKIVCMHRDDSIHTARYVPPPRPRQTPSSDTDCYRCGCSTGPTDPTAIRSDVGGHLLIESSGIQKSGKGADRSRRVVRPVKVLKNRRSGDSFRDAGERKNRKISKRF
jgi:hypothetical protein